MTGPDLFVVCKSCGAEVSPYITECPYCGNRLRKRAPRIEREGGAPRVVAPHKAKLPKLRAGEIPGIAPDVTRRPWVTIGILVVALVCVPLVAGLGRLDLITTSLRYQPWRVLIAPFVVTNLWYALVSLFAVGIFGMLLERRNGHAAVLILFLLGAVGGIAVALAAAPATIVLGANGGALALLCAWAVPPLLDQRRGEGDEDDDLIGAFVFGIVILALSFVVDEADPVAAGVGVLVGFAGGLLLSRAPKY